MTLEDIRNLRNDKDAYAAELDLSKVRLALPPGLSKRESKAVEMLRDEVQKRTEDLAESLDLQKHVAEEASLARTHFFAAASRDLRQPLRAIGLLARSLKDMTIIPHSVYRWQVALWRRSKS